MISRCALTVSLLVLFCQILLISADYQVDSDEAVPVDEDGKITCDENDPICEKYQALENYNDHGDAIFNRQQTRQTRLKCNNAVNKYYCETIQKKKCYTDGHCGDLVQDESRNHH